MVRQYTISVPVLHQCVSGELMVLFWLKYAVYIGAVLEKCCYGHIAVAVSDYNSAESQRESGSIFLAYDKTNCSGNFEKGFREFRMQL